MFAFVSRLRVTFLPSLAGKLACQASLAVSARLAGFTRKSLVTFHFID